MLTTSEPVGTLQVALAHAARLLETNPALAAEQAAEILAAVPGQPVALLLMGKARRAGGDAAAALEILEPLSRTAPDWAAAHYELGLALGNAGQGDAAVAALRRAVALKPDLPDAWRTLGDHLSVTGDSAGADAAYARHIRYSTTDPRLLEPAAALCENRIAVAEALLRAHLKQHPTDVAAIRMLAEVAARLGRYGDAETLLARCLELAPSFTAARHNYASVLFRQNKVTEALSELERLLALEPRNPSYRNLKAAILARIGEFQQSLEIYAAVLTEYANYAKVWMSYGHALKAAGRRDDSIDAYRKSIELAPNFGEAYWSLANLKTFRFLPADLRAMQSQLERPGLSDEDRLHFHFSIGKALEDAGAFADSFRHYEKGNSLHRASARYDAEETSVHVRRSKAVLSRQFFDDRAGVRGAGPRPDLHRGPATGGLDAARADPREPLRGGRDDGTPRHAGDRAGPRREEDPAPGLEVSGGARDAGPGGISRAGQAVPRADQDPAQDRRAVLHRQDAEQLWPMSV